jgi:type IV secretory pathway TraG/TraD family ATPase VirD4
MTKPLPLIVSALSGPDAHDIAIRHIERHRGPAIVTAFGADLYYRTFETRQSRGQVMRFDPFAVTGDGLNTWSPLADASTWDGALNVAWHFAATGEIEQRGVQGGDFWAIVAEQRLAPLLYAAARCGHGADQLIAWAYSDHAAAVRSTLDGLAAVAGTNRDRDELAKARASVDVFCDQPDRIRTSVDASIQSLLRAYRFTRVAQSAATAEITSDWLFSGNNTVYLIGDAKASKLLRPIMVALLESLVASDHSPEHPLLLAEVEHENVGTLIDAHAAAHLVRQDHLRRLALPARVEQPPVLGAPRRKLHFRSPITLA